MISVQQSLTPALRDGNNTYTKSTYATLGSVMQVCRDILLSHGIWMTQYPVAVATGYLGLVTKIVHAASGQWQSSLIEMPLPKNDPQGYGSAITYARRYGLSTLIGITTEDDDAEGAMPGSTIEAPPQKQLNQSTKTPAPEPRAKPKRQKEQSNSTPQPKLPRLDGVTYKTQTSNNNPPRILAMGNTHAKKEFLKSAGFRWDNKGKMWWRAADAVC